MRSVTSILYSAKSLHRIFGFLLAQYLSLLGRTCHYHVSGQEHFESAIVSARPLLFGVWHQQLLTFVPYGLQTLGLEHFVAIVEGRDRGSIWATALQNLGAFLVIRIDMNGNPVVAGKGLANIIRSMRTGRYSAIMPDGPYGPAFVAKPGAVLIAQKTGGVIVPCGAWAKHGFHLRRWDCLLCPIPFSDVTMVFQEPIFVETDMSSAELAEVLSNELHAARDKARQLTLNI